MCTVIDIVVKNNISTNKIHIHILYFSYQRNIQTYVSYATGMTNAYDLLCSYKKTSSLPLNKK